MIMVASINVGLAQGRVFKKIITNEGEANLSVRQVIQDNKGFLWIASFSGLYRYEGDDFIIKHQFKNGIKINSDVTSLIQDNQNNLWIGTNKGLSQYNLVTDELVTFYHKKSDPNSISSDKIRCLALGSQGRLWIGTNSGGLQLYENGQFVDFSFEAFNVTGPSYVKSILIDSKNRLWLGTFGNGLYQITFDGNEINKVTNYNTEDSIKTISHDDIYCIYEDADGTIAVGSRDGLNVFNEESESFSALNFVPGNLDENLNNYFRSIIKDKDDNLWIGTWAGIFICKDFGCLESGYFEFYQHKRDDIQSISKDQVNSMFCDRTGVVWLGIENALNMYDPYENQFKQLSGNIIGQLKEQSVTSFYPYKDGILMATFSDGILYKQGDEISYLSRPIQSELKDEILYSIFVDSKNNIWVGTNKGVLYRIDGITYELSKFKHSVDNLPICAMVESKDGNLLVGTRGEGLKHFNTRSLRFQADKTLSTGADINDIFIDRNENIWVATQLGVFKIGSGNSSMEYFMPDDVNEVPNPNIFLDIVESKDGQIYIGGRNGFYYYDQDEKNVKRKEFDTDKDIWPTNLRFDSNQNIWMNLNFNQIAKYNPQTGELSFFSINNGIRSSHYNRRGFYIDKEDNLFVSGFDQIYQFSTSTYKKNSFSPTPIFTGLTVNNTGIFAGDKLNGQIILSNNIQYQDDISLSHLNKDFIISFTSTSYLRSNENTFRYMLHGHDKEWVTGNTKSVHYSDLRPGKYTFEVFGANNDGLWSEKPARLNISVKPSPWLSYWAIILYAIFSFVTAYYLRKVIIARIQLKRELLIEKVKRDKEEKFNDERLRFYTNISHELRTPLTLIMGPIKQLISEDNTNNKNSKLHQLILNNSQRLLSLVNQLLDFRKSLYEGMKLKATYSNIVESIESNIAAFDYMAKEKSIYVKFSTESKIIKGWFDREKLDIIIFNILSNAFKYTPENGYVKVELKTGNSIPEFPSGHVELNITDNGKGIPKHLIEKVFERFYQVKNKSGTTNTGTGIGLSLVKSLVELHHGKIELESVPNKRTCFTIFLPLGKDMFTEEEVFDFKRDADRRTKELYISSATNKNNAFNTSKKENAPRLLIIEDNSELRDFLAGFLSQDYEVIAVNDGIQGLEACEKQNPDLVVSDVMMDNMDGLQFCKKLKSTPEISHIPVILMTALASVENKITGYKTGADDYITKPFEPELLRIRVRNILDNMQKLKKRFGDDINVTNKDLAISKADEEFLDKITVLLEKNIDNVGFDVEQFSKELGVSASQLYRKIKGISGLSPNEFIRTYRLKKAAQMILESNLTVSEVAYQVGFNDALYFSKCFKKQFGTSPSKYLASL